MFLFERQDRTPNNENRLSEIDREIRNAYGITSWVLVRNTPFPA